MKRYIYILIMCVLSLLSVSAQTTSQADIIKQINKTAAGVKTLQCDFVQTKQMSLLGEDLVSKGRMYYQQTSRLRWEYVSPYTYTFILNDSKVLLKKGSRNDVIDINKNRMFKEIANIMMNSVVGKCLTDDKTFRTAIKETQTEWVATLQPQKKDMKQMFSRIVLHFDRQQSVVVKVEMFEPSGDKTVIELQNIKTNKPVDAHVFSIQ